MERRTCGRRRNGKEEEFISVDSHDTKRTKEEKLVVVVFTKKLLERLLYISYLRQNWYFKLRNRIFRQIIGIPVGADPANLFLLYLTPDGFLNEGNWT